MIDLKPYFQTLKKNWYGILALFILFVGIVFSVTSALTQHFDIPSEFKRDTLPSIVYKRVFWELLIVLFFAAYLTLIFELVNRRKNKNQFEQKYLYRRSNNKEIIILSGNKVSVRLIEKAISAQYTIKAIYDLNPNVDGIIAARKYGIQTYSNNMSEMRKMLQLCTENQEVLFYIFMTTEYPNFVLRADEVVRSLRRHTKNFRFYHLGIEFDENLDEGDLIALMS